MMTEGARDWLPAEAMMREPVRAIVAAAVAEWSSHWLAASRLSLTGWTLATGQRSGAGDDGWRDVGGGLQISGSRRATTRLLNLALDSRAEDQEMTDRERSLLRGFGDLITDDLLERVRRLIGPDRDVGVSTQAAMIATISDGSDSILSISIPLARLIPLSRRTLPKAGRRPSQPGLRRQAVGSTSLRLEATLGTATLTLAETRDLAVGDILVLDRAVGEAAELHLANSNTVVARGVLTDADGYLALLLEPAQESKL